MSSADPRERDDLCGRELVAERPWERLAKEHDPDTWYEAEDGTDYCCREVWDRADTDRCIWHADVADKPADALVAELSEGPKRLDRAVLRGLALPNDTSLSECRLPDADLGGAGLLGARLGDASFSDADLSGAGLRGADLDGADLRRADLSGADLYSANLDSANLRHANLDGANPRRAGLGGANLWDADLCGADLRYVDLADAHLGSVDLTACILHQTTFEDATFDEATTFGAASGHENAADDDAEAASWLASHVSPRLRAFGRPATDPEPLERAETQYRTVQRLKREHDLKQDPALEIQEQHARRKRALAEGRYRDWFKLAIYRWPMGYGEKPWHVVGTSLAVILVSALLYPLAGIRVDGAERTYPTVLADPAGTAVETVRVVAESVYFSTVTFTTLGYGDVEPVGWAKALSTVESFVGALLMALLVFVLGRRATW